ncbi:MAG: cupin domain-containing protein [Acidimicrobiia bacterium]|nr:cupin domain-containing protein [Acidimicrobiia bacterium]
MPAACCDLDGVTYQLALSTMVEIIEKGQYHTGDFSEELTSAEEGNRHIGTKLLFRNDEVGVWEVRLQPGERGGFHLHDRHYFWTVVKGGIGKQRTADGVYHIRRYEEGDTSFLPHSPSDSVIHDFENAGDSEIRFITVELYD